MADRTRPLLIPELRMHAGLVDRMLDVDGGRSRKRGRVDVAAGVPVRIGAPSSLALDAIQRHGPDSEVDPEAGFRTVIAVHHRRAVGCDPRIKGPVVGVDDARVVVSQPLDDVAVKVEQIEVA